MTRYVALLRGINVGGHNVKMERLRTLFEELKLDNVATFIASGNVLFDSRVRNIAKLELQIEEHLQAALGYAVPTFIRSATELTAIAAYQPFASPEIVIDAPGTSLYISFVKSSPPAAVQEKTLALRTATDEFHLTEREVYWICRIKLSESPLFQGDPLGKAIGMPMTMRNVTTVRKLAALASKS
jgi:uncharacterized protein (DUF1697 family)